MLRSKTFARWRLRTSGILAAVLLGVAGYAQKPHVNLDVKVEVDLVLVNAIVTDPKGRYVM
ncbi:MAG: hypothetical protein HY646_10625, partial [Acidobacteria bacterium]|nr:hypothetical protein [Acidobacteriota bacterium]